MFKKIIALVCALVVIVGVYPTLSQYLLPTESNLDVINDLREGIDPGAPRMINDDLRLEKSTVKGDELINNFTLVNVELNEIDPNSYKEQATKAHSNTICGNEAYAEILDRGISIGYIYKDKSGKQIFYLNINKDTCG